MDSNVSVCSTDTGFSSMIETNNSSNGDSIITTPINNKVPKAHNARCFASVNSNASSQSLNSADDPVACRQNIDSICSHEDVTSPDSVVSGHTDLPCGDGGGGRRRRHRRRRQSAQDYSKDTPPQKRKCHNTAYSTTKVTQMTSSSPLSTVKCNAIATPPTRTTIIMVPEEEHAQLVSTHQRLGREQQKQQQQQSQLPASFEAFFNTTANAATAISSHTGSEASDNVVKNVDGDCGSGVGVSLSSLDAPLVKREENWLKTHKFIEYQPKRDYRYGTVLYSHETQKRYILQSANAATAVCAEAARNSGNLNYNNGIDINAFCGVFIGIGHTFCIDQKISYVRPFTLDVDCLLCHRPNTSYNNQQMGHFNQNDLDELLNVVKIKIDHIMGNLGGGDKTKANLSVWERPNTHNYHVYTNMMVSAPLHAHLVNAIRVELNPSKYVLDMPSLMPLPCSQKRGGSEQNDDGSQRTIAIGLPYIEFWRRRNDASLLVYPQHDRDFYENCHLCDSHIIERNLDKYVPVLSLTQGTSSLRFALSKKVTKTKDVPVLERSYLEISCLNTNLHSDLFLETVSAYFANLNALMMELHRDTVENASMRVDYTFLENNDKFVEFTHRYIREINDFFYIVNQYLVSSNVKTRDLLYDKTYDRDTLLQQRRSDLFEITGVDGVLVKSWCLSRDEMTRGSNGELQRQLGREGRRRRQRRQQHVQHNDSDNESQDDYYSDIDIIDNDDDDDDDDSDYDYRNQYDNDGNNINININKIDNTDDCGSRGDQSAELIGKHYALLTGSSENRIGNAEGVHDVCDEKSSLKNRQSNDHVSRNGRCKLSINSNAIDAFVRESAYTHKGWNLQHYVVALHKALVCEDDLTDFKRWLLLLYRSTETDGKKLPRCVRVFIVKYALPVEKAYSCEYDDIVRYMGTFYHNKLMINMNVSQVIDCLITNALSVTTIEEYARRMRNKSRTLIKDACEDFYNVVFPILQRTRFYIRFQKFMYALENTKWYYERTEEFTLAQSTWPVDLINCVSKAIMTKQNEFSVDFKSHPIPFLVPTECGVFNVITGMYVSHTPLLGFVKCRRHVVYPQLRDKSHSAYIDLNEDILAFRDSHSRFFYNLVTNRLDALYTHYMFVPAIISLRFAYKINKDVVVKFFKAALDYRLDGASAIVELYPFRRNLVAYTLLLFHMFGIEILSSYPKLCKALFAIVIEEGDGDDNRCTDKTYQRVTKSHWLRNYKQIMGKSYDESLDAFRTVQSTSENDNECSFLRVLRSFDNGSVRFSTHECVIGVALLAALFKMPAFTTFFAAFGYPNAPKCVSMPTPTKHNTIHDWDSVSTYRPNVSAFKMIAKRTRAIVLGNRPKCKMDNALFNVALQLGFCVSFDRRKYVELLNMLTVSMVTTNVLKLMMILYGGMNCGKSFLLDALSYALDPFVFAMNKNLDKHNERGGVIAKNLMIRCNELPCIDATTLKAYTGEDANSNQVFYSQNYELSTSGQALFFAGTNYHIQFRDESFSRKQSVIDPALINRLHAITLTGEHQESTTTFDGRSSIFAMIANSRFFVGTTDRSVTRRHFALMWLLYENYLHTRDPNTYNPRVNLNTEDSVCYRQMVYTLNSDLYRLLNNCDLCYELGFTMEKKNFMQALSCAFSDSITTNSSTAISSALCLSLGGDDDYTTPTATFNSNQTQMTRKTFFYAFKTMYNVDLDALQDDDYVPNFQSINLVRRVMDDFKTEYRRGEKLTEHDLQRKLAKYKHPDDRYQADEYFRRTQPEFLYCKKDNIFVLYNYRFVNDDDDDDEYDDDDDDNNHQKDKNQRHS